MLTVLTVRPPGGAHCGRRDRHAAIGAGAIGAEPFREIIAALPGVPFVVETPGGKTGHARDIAMLKALR